VFQDNALISGHTVGDNVALPLHEIKRLDESAIRRKVYQVIREVIHQLFGRTLD
jgi:ABC-type transporter Mla maintaining outer membrane lipid asymmetry ATPase subunit MlaF